MPRPEMVSHCTFYNQINPDFVQCPTSTGSVVNTAIAKLTRKHSNKQRMQ